MNIEVKESLSIYQKRALEIQKMANEVLKYAMENKILVEDVMHELDEYLKRGFYN